MNPLRSERAVVGWAKARLRAVPTIEVKLQPMLGTLRFAHPTLAAGRNYFPGHTGLRFSANAFMPSLASSVIAKSAIWLSV
jgi:hypothetical protein